MTHKIDFVKGKEYWIDEKFNRPKHKVTLLHFWKETMIFAKVKNADGYEWETMLNRLTEIKPTKLTYDDWFNKNHVNIDIELAELGADRELDFSYENEYEKRYNKYLES